MNLFEDLDRAGAVLLDRHFVYTGGKHGPDFVRIDAILPDEELLNRVCGLLVQKFLGAEVEAVTACADDRCDMLAYYSAKHLGVTAGSKEQLRGKRTLIVEDVLTSGGSVINIRQEAEEHGADVVGASLICNRDQATINAKSLGVPRLETLVNVDLVAFEPDQCGLCEVGVPIVTDVGRGATFMQNHPDYAGSYVELLAS